MVYAVYSNRPVVTTKSIDQLKTPLSEETKKRKEFIHSHIFSIETDPLTNEKILIATPK